MTIVLTDKQKTDLDKILQRSGSKVTAMIAVHMAFPDAKLLDCARYVNTYCKD